MENNKPKLITQSTVISEYGLTKTLIKKYLPEPILKTNPIFKRAAPMRLWPEQTVREVCERDDVKQDIAKSKVHSQASLKVAARKRDELLQEVEGRLDQIKVTEILPKDEVERRAFESKRDHEEDLGHFDHDLYNIKCIPEDVLERWTVNYIRHNLTDYDQELYNMAGRIGCHEAYHVYKAAVLDKIAEAYPYLASECNRQKNPKPICDF